jgi:hypothetical protein
MGDVVVSEEGVRRELIATVAIVRRVIPVREEEERREEDRPEVTCRKETPLAVRTTCSGKPTTSESASRAMAVSPLGTLLWSLSQMDCCRSPQLELCSTTCSWTQTASLWPNLRLGLRCASGDSRVTKSWTLWWETIPDFYALTSSGF